MHDQHVGLAVAFERLVTLPPAAALDDVNQTRPTFEKFGRVTKIWVARQPSGFAFIEYEDKRDAEAGAAQQDEAFTLGWPRTLHECFLLREAKDRVFQ